MKIRRLRMVNFRRFADYEVALHPGLNLIVGGNESGKSTIVEALAVALFGDPASKAREAKELERWGSTGATRLELEFEHGGSRYRLTKDFGAARVELTNDSDGSVVGDRTSVDSLVRHMVGFHTRDAFESVASVRQGELAVLGERARRGELVPMIERKMTSSSGMVDAASVLRHLDKEVARVRVGLDRPAKRPGPLKALEIEREELSQKTREFRTSWAAVVRTMNELTEERQRFTGSEAELERLHRAVDAEESRGALCEKLERVRESLAQCEAKLGKIRQLRKDIETAWDKIGGTRHEQEKRAIVNAKADFDASDRRVRDLAASAPRWSGERADRRAAVGTSIVGLSGLVALLAGVIGWPPPFRVWLILGGIGAVIVTGLLFRRTVRIWAFARDLRLEIRERQKLGTVLTAALSKMGFPDYVQFEQSIEVFDRARMDAERYNAILTDICGGEDPAAYEEALEAEASALAHQRREFESELEGLGGTSAALAPAEIAKLRAERDSLREQVDRLTESIGRREWQLGRMEAGDSLPDLEARLEFVEREREALERRLRVLRRAREGLEIALASTKEEAASVLEPIVERVLSRVTLGRYVDVEVGRDLGLSVGNPDGDSGAPATLAPRELSEGTVDQLYLAIRFALLEFLSTREGTPFVLDDALVNSDPERRSATLRLLREISSERQVIMFSCEEHGAEFADAVVLLPRCELADVSGGAGSVPRRAVEA